MTLVSHVSPSLSCNTNKLRHKLSRKRGRSWCFTWNNYTEKDLSLLSQPHFFKNKIKKLIFQEEIGENKTKHLQGFVQFKNQVDFEIIKAQIPKCHIEKARSVAAAIKYCSKKESRSGIRYMDGISNHELWSEKKEPLTHEEIMFELKRQAWAELEEDKFHFWSKNLLDF